MASPWAARTSGREGQDLERARRRRREEDLAAREALQAPSRGRAQKLIVVSCSSWRPTWPAVARAGRSARRTGGLSASGVTQRPHGDERVEREAQAPANERRSEAGRVGGEAACLAPQRVDLGDTHRLGRGVWRGRPPPSLLRPVRAGDVPLLERLAARGHGDRQWLSASPSAISAPRGWGSVASEAPRLGAVRRIDLSTREDDRAAEEARLLVPEHTEDLEPLRAVPHDHHRRGMAGHGRLSFRIRNLTI